MIHAINKNGVKWRVGYMHFHDAEHVQICGHLYPITEKHKGADGNLYLTVLSAHKEQITTIITPDEPMFNDLI